MTDDLEKYEALAKSLDEGWPSTPRPAYFEIAKAITELVAMVRDARAEQEEAQRNYLNVKTWWNGERESCRKLQATISAMSAEIDELTERAEAAERELAQVNRALNEAGQYKLTGEDVSRADRIAGLHSNYLRRHKDACEANAQLAELKRKMREQRDIVLEEAAKIAESAMLPCDIGGDLILDRYTSDTIAKAIRALKGE